MNYTDLLRYALLDDPARVRHEANGLLDVAAQLTERLTVIREALPTGDVQTQRDGRLVLAEGEDQIQSLTAQGNELLSYADRVEASSPGLARTLDALAADDQAWQQFPWPMPVDEGDWWADLQLSTRLRGFTVDERVLDRLNGSRIRIADALAVSLSGWRADAGTITPAADTTVSPARVITLISSTPDQISEQAVTLTGEGAVITAGAESVSVTSAEVIDALATLTLLDRVADPADSVADSATVQVTADMVEAMLAPVDEVRRDAVSGLRESVAPIVDLDLPWRAWCATAARPGHGVVAARTVFVLDTAAGLVTVTRTGDAATLTLASKAAVHRCLADLVTY